MDNKPDQPVDSAAEPPSATGSVTAFFHEFCGGSESAAGELWRRFFPRMQGLARRTLTRFPQRLADADDAVQSAFVAFWQRARQENLVDGTDRDDLWRLLAVITVRTTLRQVRRQQALKRGGSNIRVESDFPASPTPFRLDEAMAEVPTQEFDLQSEELLAALPEELREIVVLRLMGHSTPEIAALLQCTERKVQRKVALVKLRFEHILRDSPD